MTQTCQWRSRSGHPEQVGDVVATKDSDMAMTHGNPVKEADVRRCRRPRPVEISHEPDIIAECVLDVAYWSIRPRAFLSERPSSFQSLAPALQLWPAQRAGIGSLRNAIMRRSVVGPNCFEGMISEPACTSAVAVTCGSGAGPGLVVATYCAEKPVDLSASRGSSTISRVAMEHHAIATRHPAPTGVIRSAAESGSLAAVVAS